MIESFKTHTPCIHPSAWVHASAVLIGEVSLAAQVSVWPTAVIRGDVESIKVGEYTNIQDGSVIHASHPSIYSKAYPTVVGAYNTIGHQVHLHGCVLEKYCLIGSGSIVLDGAHIHSEVLIGAGSLVTPNQVLKGGYLYVGSPVRQIRPLTEKEKAHIIYSAKHYKKLKDAY